MIRAALFAAATTILFACMPRCDKTFHKACDAVLVFLPVVESRSHPMDH